MPSDQDNAEFPDATAEELEALIAQEETKLNEARQKTKLLSLQKKLKGLQQETLQSSASYIGTRVLARPAVRRCHENTSIKKFLHEIFVSSRIYLKP